MIRILTDEARQRTLIHIQRSKHGNIMARQLPKSQSTQSVTLSGCNTCGYPSHCGSGHTVQYKDYEVDGGTVREVQVCKHCTCPKCSPKTTEKTLNVKPNKKLF